MGLKGNEKIHSCIKSKLWKVNVMKVKIKVKIKLLAFGSENRWMRLTKLYYNWFLRKLAFKCCEFWPTFGCRGHHKASQNTFLTVFRCFFFFLNLISSFQMKNIKNGWDSPVLGFFPCRHILSWLVWCIE